MRDSELLRLAVEWGISPTPGHAYESNLLGFARAVMEIEREACAKVCDDKVAEWAPGEDASRWQLECAKAIRMRAGKPANA